MTRQQREALQKLMAGPARQNAPGQPLGIAKHADGTTLNGNLCNALLRLGWIEAVQTGEKRIAVARYTHARYEVAVIEYRITGTGQFALVE